VPPIDDNLKRQKDEIVRFNLETNNESCHTEYLKILIPPETHINEFVGIVFYATFIRVHKCCKNICQLNKFLYEHKLVYFLCSYKNIDRRLRPIFFIHVYTVY